MTRLRLIIIVLGLLISSELLFLTLFFQKKNNTNDVPNEEYVNATLSRSVVSPLAFRYLSTLNRGGLESTIVTNTYSGTIRKIFNRPSSYFGFGYKVAISIVGDDGKSSILIGNDAFKTLDIRDSNNSAIQFNELKVGDAISVVEVVDLSQTNPYLLQQVSIVKER